MNTLELQVKNEGRSKRCTGTSLSGYIHVRYNELVEMFGEPLTGKDTDEYKVDAEWHLHLESHGGNEGFVTIYNYKDGHNYLGGDGKPVSAITEWHVGSKTVEEYHNIQEFIKSFIGKERSI